MIDKNQRVTGRDENEELSEEGCSTENSLLHFWGRLNANDYFYLQKYAKLASCPMWKRKIFAFNSIVFGIIFGLFAFFRINEYVGSTIMVAALIVARLFLVHPYQFKFWAKLCYWEIGHKCKQTRVTLSQRGIDMVNDDVSNYTSWTSIPFLVTAPEGVLFFGGDMPLFFLPIRLFTNDEALKQLFRLVESKNIDIRRM